MKLHDLGASGMFSDHMRMTLVYFFSTDLAILNQQSEDIPSLESFPGIKHWVYSNLINNSSGFQGSPCFGPTKKFDLTNHLAH